MRHQIFCKVAGAAILVAGLAACGGSGSDNGGGFGDGSGGGRPAQDSFFATVNAFVATSPDNTEPREIDSIAVTSPEDSEPAALDS